MTDEARSYERITLNDLARLAQIARRDREDRFTRRPRWRPYADRVLCVALCQGAALHYVDGRNGVKDLDVYAFYARFPTCPWRGGAGCERAEASPCSLTRGPSTLPPLTGSMCRGFRRLPIELS